MNGETAILILFIAFPVVLAGLAGSYFVLSKRADAFACPACKTLTAKDEITIDGVNCPHCGWRVVSNPSLPVRGTAPEVDLVEDQR
jgi:hypothetical protein